MKEKYRATNHIVYDTKKCKLKGVHRQKLTQRLAGVAVAFAQQHLQQHEEGRFGEEALASGFAKAFECVFPAPVFVATQLL